MIAAIERLTGMEWKGQGTVFLVGLGHGGTHWIAATFYLLLPFITRDLGLTYTEAGALVAIFHLSAFAANFGSGLLVDVTAVAHLFGGEAKLLADVHHAFTHRGFAMRAAIAPTAGAAWALAHYGPDRAILASEDDMEARLSDLPVAALRLDGDVLTVLRRLGLKRLGELGTVEEVYGFNPSR